MTAVLRDSRNKQSPFVRHQNSVGATGSLSARGGTGSKLPVAPLSRAGTGSKLPVAPLSQAVPVRFVRRRGYILIVVLGLTAIVTTLGLAFLDEHSTVMPAAMNRKAATRAQYLAESGIDIGSHFLLYPPTTVAVGDYWTGATGIAIDATADYTNVAVIQDATNEDIFTIKAIGVVHDTDGTINGKHQIIAKVLLPEIPKWKIPFAWLGTNRAWLMWPFKVYGDIHSNGDLRVESWCNGALSAVNWVNWWGDGPVTSITDWTDPYPAPSADAAVYATYTLRGTEYTAYVYNHSDMNEGDAVALNAIDMSATNPGRIILAKSGGFKIKSNVNLLGTLVVDGDLRFEENIVLTAMPNYPALVVEEGIQADGNDSSIQIAGSVLCGEWLWDRNMDRVVVEVTGAVIAGEGLYLEETDGDYKFRWDADRATFWNFEDADADLKPITILEWKES